MANNEASDGNPIQVSAFETQRRRLPGPAIAGTSRPELVVSVTDGRGASVTGLVTKEFELQGLTARVGGLSTARTIAIEHSTEVVPGIYVVGFQEVRGGGLTGPASAIVVTVTPHGARGPGRTVVPMVRD